MSMFATRKNKDRCLVIATFQKGQYFLAKTFHENPTRIPQRVMDFLTEAYEANEPLFLQDKTMPAKQFVAAQARVNSMAQPEEYLKVGILQHYSTAASLSPASVVIFNIFDRSAAVIWFALVACCASDDSPNPSSPPTISMKACRFSRKRLQTDRHCMHSTKYTSPSHDLLTTDLTL